MSQPTRTQTTVTKILGILLKTCTPTIIHHYSVIGALRSDAQSGKADFCLLNYLQERPPAVRSFCSDTHRKFRKCNFLSYAVRMVCVEPVVCSQGADSRFLGRVGAVQWSGLLCPWVWGGIPAIACMAGTALQQRWGPCAQDVLKNYCHCGQTLPFLPIYQKQDLWEANFNCSWLIYIHELNFPTLQHLFWLHFIMTVIVPVTTRQFVIWVDFALLMNYQKDSVTYSNDI